MHLKIEDLNNKSSPSFFLAQPGNTYSTTSSTDLAEKDTPIQTSRACSVFKSRIHLCNILVNMYLYVAYKCILTTIYKLRCYFCDKRDVYLVSPSSN
jgi:hypothetical protein